MAHAGGWEVVDEQSLGRAGRGSLKRVSVRLPDGGEFDQYVMLVPAAVVVMGVNDRDEVLMLHRYRYIVGRWVWELPGGYIEDDESPTEAALRELLEETGWRAGQVEHVVSFQPMVGAADATNHVFLARGLVHASETRDINEAGDVEWIPLRQAMDLIRRGEIVGAASVVALTEFRAELAERLSGKGGT